MKVKNTLSTILLFVLCSCISTAPSGNLPFSTIESARDLAGTYRNKGITGEGYPSVYLSKIIWREDKAIVHEEIDAISVVELSPGLLEVKALPITETSKVSHFKEDKDFEIQNGRIILENESGIAGFKADEPLVGPYYGRRELGLDASGHGKYKSSFSVAGLVYLVIPIAMGGTDEVRFEKQK